MLSLPVVKHLDVLEARCLHVVMRGIANAMHSLVLKAIEPTLRCCVIPAVSFATHGRLHAKLPKQLLVGMGAILTPAIRVVKQSFPGSLGSDGSE